MQHRSIVAAAAVPPAWYVFRALRQKKAAEWFEANGVEAWFPTRTTHLTRYSNGRQNRVAVERPVISGYVFAAFRGVPLWHVIKDRSEGKVFGVFHVDGTPRQFTDAEMLCMTQVPHRLEAIRKAEAEAKTIRPGDTALHPTLGRVPVTGVDGDIAKILLPMLGGEREIVCGILDLEKVA